MTLSARGLKRYWRESLLAFLYVAPTLGLAALGGLWLWQEGYLPHFAGATLAAAAGIVALRSFWTPAPHGITLVTPPGASEAERTAKAALRTLMDGASAADVSSVAAAQALATRTVLAVADAHHPGDRTAWLNVTVPELLLMAEDVAHRLREMLNRDFPVLRHVDISLAMKGHTAVGRATGLWNVVRVLRFANPPNALMQEARAKLLNRALGDLTASAKAALAARLVREVGEAAIRLYAGAYRRTEAELLPTAPTLVPPPPPKPITILIAGQGNAGKSSVLNALAGDVRVPTGLTLPTDRFFTIELDHPEAGRLILIDSPGVGTEPTASWIEKVREADLVIWAAAANRADRAADQKALRALRDMGRNDVRLRETPIVLAATHADRLNPPMEWAPPYDPATGTRPKERSMCAAIAALSASLAIPADRCALVSAELPDERAWNVAALWACIHAALPEAKKKQLERGLREDGWLKVAADTLRSVTGAVGVIHDELVRSP